MQFMNKHRSLRLTKRRLKMLKLKYPSSMWTYSSDLKAKIIQVVPKNWLVRQGFVTSEEYDSIKENQR